MKGALDVHQVLLAEGVPHEIVRLPHSVTAASEIPAVLGLPPEVCVQVRVYEVAAAIPPQPGAAGSPYPDAADAPAGSGLRLIAALGSPQVPPDTDRLLAAAGGGRWVRPARSDAVSAATDFRAALVSPVGLPAGLPRYADAALRPRPAAAKDAVSDVCYAPTGDGGTVLAIRFTDLLVATGACLHDLSKPSEASLHR